MKYTETDVRNLITAGAVRVYDGGERWGDRYTVWLDPAAFPLDDWGITGFGMSDNPNHPQGFNQCLTDDLDDYLAENSAEARLESWQVPASVLEAIRLRLSA